jgi:hypothetical protein
MESDFHYCIDRFVVFMGTIHLAGWAFAVRAPIRQISLMLRSGARLEFSHIGLQSDDVVAVFGQAARNSRFEEHWFCAAPSAEITDGKLVVDFADGSTAEITRLGVSAVAADPTHAETRRFFDRLNSMQPGRLLEIGSRARSGVSRRALIPSPWEYIGLDILEGENVDVVGDAHQLSKIFPANSFRAVMAFSVLEHLLMPWKFALELNRVMEVNGVGYLTTHQSWPLHDEPWDFWRFSADSWTALFNLMTGFKILAVQSGEPAFIVANHCHAITDFPNAPGGFLSSVVLFQKVAETRLQWDVELAEIVRSSYPTSTARIEL